MRKEYTKPDFKAIKFSVDDILTTSIVVKEAPQTFDGAQSLGSIEADKVLTD